jgi:hypothetical protein
VWIHVIAHFTQFLTELELKPEQRLDALGKAERVARSLFARYFPGQQFRTDCYVIAGSLGKGTAIRPPSDVDLIFKLPFAEHARFDGLAGNKQSQLIQEVKGTLQFTYPRTDMAGDGPVVKVPFDSYYFEVVPAWLCNDGTYLNAHTRLGGFWEHSAPAAEAQFLNEVDLRTAGKATHLIKMMKAWKVNCNVDLKSICLEVACECFADQWVYRDKDIFWYDWMVRDFFAFLLNLQSPVEAIMGVTGKKIPFGEAWRSKAQTAYERALKACQLEHDDKGYSASEEWQKIFGTAFKLDIINLLATAQR